jgi:hypothetical protein
MKEYQDSNGEKMDKKYIVNAIMSFGRFNREYLEKLDLETLYNLEEALILQLNMSSKSNPIVSAQEAFLNSNKDN